MRSNGKHLVIVAVLVVVVSVITYFILTAIYQLPEAASVQSGPIDLMFNVQFIFISFLFALIVVFMVYSIIVFRRKPGDEEAGAYMHGNTGLEIAWTIVPLITVIAIGVWAALVLTEITAAQENEIAVQVYGRQWSWAFSYSDYEEIGTIDRLVLPVDQPVRLEMTSDDVIHSFWVPEFRLKQDLLPGQITTLRVTPNKIGEYKILCAEICGFDHSNMRAPISVVSQADFDSWVAENSFSPVDLTPVERGELWASRFGCVGCHSVDGSARVGPTWLNLFGKEELLEDGTSVLVDEAYILESISNPGLKITDGFQDVMPANLVVQFEVEQTEILNQRGVEIDIAKDLVAYIQSLVE